ncbi:MAG: hypothetical protein WBQ59_07495 [Candidatus Acidiferrum sp.]
MQFAQDIEQRRDGGSISCLGSRGGFRGRFAGWLRTDVGDEANPAVVGPEDYAVMLGAAFVIAPFRGNEGAASGLPEDELRRGGHGFAGVEPI